MRLLSVAARLLINDCLHFLKTSLLLLWKKQNMQFSNSALLKKSENPLNHSLPYCKFFGYYASIHMLRLLNQIINVEQLTSVDKIYLDSPGVCRLQDNQWWIICYLTIWKKTCINCIATIIHFAKTWFGDKLHNGTFENRFFCISR